MDFLEDLIASSGNRPAAKPSHKADASEKSDGGGNISQKFQTKRDRDDIFDENNKSATDRVLEDAGKFISRMKDRVTPGFVKRYNTSKIYHMGVQEAEA
jgi:hypothetical protein